MSAIIYTIMYLQLVGLVCNSDITLHPHTMNLSSNVTSVTFYLFNKKEEFGALLKKLK